MVKKKIVARVIALAALCTMMLTTSASAGKVIYTFDLHNTGKTYCNSNVSSANNKIIQSDPWTLKVTSISCSGVYGIRFVPVIKNTNYACSKSAVWRNGTGYGTVAYSTGENVLSTYKLCARMDDSYRSNFKTTGWWNADKLKNQ